ncbi:uncharacterized protein LOC141651141 [Silene latifolia]|uniref:uncharacterized protein LOC141651141 n=1 Tax=Silene latifolia TaxID=37657 RepID=UPI003D77DD14
MARTQKQIGLRRKDSKFWVEDGLLFTKGHRIFVPKAAGLRKMLLQECHDTLWAGHPGWQRTLCLLKRSYYWPQMKDDVMEYTKTCLICQQDKGEKQKAGNCQQPYCLPPVADTYGGRTKKAHEYVKEWNVNAEIARAYLEKASRRMKKWADQNRRPREFKVGDMVMVKLNKEQMRFLRGRDKRLVRKYEGPIQVIKRIGEVAYKLDRPAWMKCHPVFHVSCLKPYHPDPEDPTRNKSKRANIRSNQLLATSAD